jgi:hypothetical protein
LSFAVAFEVLPLNRRFICGSCNKAGSFHDDIKSHQRTCENYHAHLNLQNGFCFEQIHGFTGANGVTTKMRPWLVSGDDYRGVRDSCNISTRLVCNQRSDWTPSMPMVALDGSELPSYRTFTSILYAMPYYTPKMWGPYQSDHRQAALIQAHNSHRNFRQAVEQAEDNYLNRELHEYLDDLSTALTAMTTERNNLTTALAAMTTERNTLQQRLTAATTAMENWPDGDFDGVANGPQSIETMLSQRQDQFRVVLSQSQSSQENGSG